MIKIIWFLIISFVIAVVGAFITIALLLASVAHGSVIKPTSCQVGIYGKAPHRFVGERFVVTNIHKSLMTVSNIIVVFYDNRHEIGSVDVGNDDSSTDALGAVPAVYITSGQSLEWTLPAGWSGTASSCTIAGIR